MRSVKGDLPDAPDRELPRSLVRIFFWLVITSLYLMGGLALLLRSQFGPLGELAPAPTMALQAPAEPELIATPTLTPTPWPTRTPTPTLFPTLTPRP